jgi:hypothetical protein
MGDEMQDELELERLGRLFTGLAGIDIVDLDVTDIRKIGEGFRNLLAQQAERFLVNGFLRSLD